MAIVSSILTVVVPADHVAGPAQGHWTAADYARLPQDGERYEMIEGTLYMTPGASDVHQTANNRFQTYLTICVEFPGLGRVFGPPFDVELSPTTTVQPDVMVVLQAHVDRITPRGIVGPPDLIVEIASPSTATHDRNQKLQAYAQAGVGEYWIAEPYARTVELLVLDQDRYRTLGVFQGAALLPSRVVTGLPVRVEQFFSNPA